MRTDLLFSKPYVKNFNTEESPSGMIARSGTYNVRSRVIDDDGEVYSGMLFVDTRSLHLLTLRRLWMVLQACQGMVNKTWTFLGLNRRVTIPSFSFAVLFVYSQKYSE